MYVPLILPKYGNIYVVIKKNCTFIIYTDSRSLMKPQINRYKIFPNENVFKIFRKRENSIAIMINVSFICTTKFPCFKQTKIISVYQTQ